MAVIVPGSPDRPHFTGKAYVRVGPKTEEASEQQFENLIAQRSSKVYEIQRWKGKEVTATWMRRNAAVHVPVEGGNTSGVIEDCSQFWVTLLGHGNQRTVHPLALIDLSFDSEQNRLKLLLWKT